MSSLRGRRAAGLLPLSKRDGSKTAAFYLCGSNSSWRSTDVFKVITVSPAVSSAVKEEGALDS